MRPVVLDAPQQKKLAMKSCWLNRTIEQAHRQYTHSSRLHNHLSSKIPDLLTPKSDQTGTRGNSHLPGIHWCVAQTATERTDTRWVINSQTLISSEEVTRNASPSPSEGETSQSRTNERTLHLWISGVWGGGWGGGRYRARHI